MKFELGMDVVCIKDSGEWTQIFTTKLVDGPQKGDVAKIVGFKEWVFHEDSPLFLELDKFPSHAWNSKFFRPVKKTDISIFTAMLNPAPTAPKKVLEDA